MELVQCPITGGKVRLGDRHVDIVRVGVIYGHEVSPVL